MRLIQDFFKFNKNERRGITCLIILVSLLIYFRYRHKIIPHFYPEPIENILTSDDIKTDALTKVEAAIIPKTYKKKPKKEYKDKSQKNKSKRKPEKKSHYKKEAKPQIELKNFDPNLIDSLSLTKMGINRYAISNWMKFRRMGGRIKSVDKMKSIYGLKSHEFERIQDYLVFEKEEKKEWKSYPETVKPETPPINLEINSATAQDFQQLRGIGPVFSKRIIKFRDLLGGFQNVDQLKEVYGIEDSLFMTIVSKLHCKGLNETGVIRINELTQDSLKKHPYISWKQAKLIVRYRDAHGSFSNEEEFRKMRFLKEDDFLRLIPYLDFNSIIDISMSKETKE